MIMGECPYCNEHMWNPIYTGDKPLPLFQKLTTECCGKTVWLKHSRVDPVAYSEEGFLKEYKVDEKTRNITPLQTKDKE